MPDVRSGGGGHHAALQSFLDLNDRKTLTAEIAAEWVRREWTEPVLEIEDPTPPGPPPGQGHGQGERRGQMGMAGWPRLTRGQGVVS